jgi:hypothetical protein
LEERNERKEFVIFSYHHQSASNRWDLELNSLTITTNSLYNSSFYDDHHYYIYVVSQAGWRKSFLCCHTHKHIVIVLKLNSMCMFSFFRVHGYAFLYRSPAYCLKQKLYVHTIFLMYVSTSIWVCNFIYY